MIEEIYNKVGPYLVHLGHIIFFKNTTGLVKRNLNNNYEYLLK